MMLPLLLQMFHFWINTAFIDREYLCLHKAYIDGPDKDKHHKEFEADFKLEMFLDRVRALPLWLRRPVAFVQCAFVTCAGTMFAACLVFPPFFSDR